MADFNGNIISVSTMSGYIEIDGNENISVSQGIIEGARKTQYYLMRGIDSDCGSLTYRTWVVVNTPDINGSQYSGIKCGASNLQDIIVAAKWIVEL